MVAGLGVPIFRVITVRCYVNVMCIIFFHRQYIWYLPYYVKVDGQLVHPTLLPAIDWFSFSSDLHITSTQGARYQILTGVQTVESSSLFSLYLQHKMATVDYKSMESALKAAWLRQHTGL